MLRIGGRGSFRHLFFFFKHDFDHAGEWVAEGLCLFSGSDAVKWNRLVLFLHLPARGFLRACLAHNAWHVPDAGPEGAGENNTAT